MNGITVFCFVALVIYSATATPCTDICTATCNLDKPLCNAVALFGDLCEVNFNTCNQVCSTVCNCVDTCQAECQTAVADCETAAQDAIAKADCQLQVPVCLADCQVKCAANTVAGAIKQAQGA